MEGIRTVYCTPGSDQITRRLCDGYQRSYHGAMAALPRMIDANANRAREALRVMEDAARFGLDDGGLSGACKLARHDLRAALDRLPAGWVMAHRDTGGDVGTGIMTDAERSRLGLADVAEAAGKRATEALRVIEEALKAIDGQAAVLVEAIRYRVYEIERALNGRLVSGQARQWRVCVLLTEATCRLPWLDVARACIDGGVECLQLREKHLDGGDLLMRCEQLIAIARPAGVSVIVNDRVDIALAAGADGVHVGQSDLSVDAVRRIAGTSMLVGVSTHDSGEAQRAIDSGCDYCGVGAFFASDLKPDRSPSGPAYMRAFARDHRDMPHLAIGGITPENIEQVIEVGGRGVAVSSVVCGADDPASVVARLRGVVEQVSEPAESI